MKHQESTLQISCVKWFRMQYPKLARNLISIPNGGARFRREAAIMKAEGIVAGAADLFLFYPSQGFHGLAIEMKTPQGRQQPSQKIWQQAVEEFGYKYVIVRSIYDFITLMKGYIHGQI